MSSPLVTSSRPRGGRLGITLTLAQAGFGFRRGETRTRFLVVEAHQELALLDLVVELTGTSATWPRIAAPMFTSPLPGSTRPGAAATQGVPVLASLFGGFRLAREIRSFAQHVPAERGSDESGNNCNGLKHDV